MSAILSLLLPVALVFLVGLTVLIPPVAFARAFVRFARATYPAHGLAMRAVWLVVAVVPLAINIGYMALTYGDLSAGRLELDENLAVAVVVSWASFWGRVAIGRKGLRRSRSAARNS